MTVSEKEELKKNIYSQIKNKKKGEINPPFSNI